jgi:hypothetical protein
LNGEHLAGARLAVAADTFVDPDTRVGDDQVQGRFGVGAKDPLAHRGAIRHVDRFGESRGSALPAFGRDLLESLLVATAEIEPCPGARVVARERRSDPAGGASDEDVTRDHHGGTRCWRRCPRL